MPGCLLGIVSLVASWPARAALSLLFFFYSNVTRTDHFPFKEVSPDKQTTAILEYDADKCFVIVLDKQAFHTKGSIYLNAKGDWDGNDLFRFYSSDIGVNYEFRRTENGWVGTPEDRIRFVEERE
ncbi:MAG: hypothetical protein IJJ33_14285 [Victivallales bacterium]|nr:hypothetical protein [Victivallales bacterium]